jgi:hypothetical protein
MAIIKTLMISPFFEWILGKLGPSSSLNLLRPAQSS